MRRVSAFFFSCMLLFPTTAWPQEEAKPSGFSGSAVSQAYSPFMDIVFLGESDGYVSALNASEKRVISRFRVCREPIVLIACHPEKNELCLVESNGLSRHVAHFLSFDGVSFSEMKSETLFERPEYACFSPKGGLLAFTSRTARGIILKETSGYSTIDGFSGDCGPASFVTIGNSEKSLLQYAPQGRIIYRSLPLGSVIQEAKTVPNLGMPTLSSDKKTIYAVNQGNFIAIDSQNGKTQFTILLKNLSAFSPPDDDGKTILCLDDGRYQVIDITSRKAPTAYLSARSPLSSMIKTASGLSAIGRSGTLYLSAPDGSMAPLGPDRFSPVLFISTVFSGSDSGFVFCGTDSTLLLSERELLEASDETGILPRPLELEAKGLTSLSSFGSSLYAAHTTGSKSEVSCIEGFSGDFLRIPLESDSAVTRVSRSGFGVLAIQENGVLSRLDSGTAKRLLSISGIQDAAAVSPSRIAIGKIRGGSLSAPLLFFSLSTGELSPAVFEAIAVLRIIPLNEDRFAALCIEETDKGVMTVIREFYGTPLSSRIIAMSLGEHFGAQLEYDGSGTIYSAFGDDNVITVYGKDGNDSRIELTDFPLKLRIGAKSLCVLHADGSFSVVGTSGGGIGRFAFIPDGRLIKLE